MLRARGPLSPWYYFRPIILLYLQKVAELDLKCLLFVIKTEVELF